MDKKIILKIEDFDTTNLPEDCRDKNQPSFKSAIQEYIERDYGKSGLFVTVEINNSLISVTQKKELENELEKGIVCLQKGDYKKGKSILQKLFYDYPNNSVVLFNLGMIYSDESDLNNAIELLTKATEIDNTHAHAWTALAVAQMRDNNIEAATKAANTAAQIDSNDPYVLRTAGTVIAQSGNNSGACFFLEKAAKLAPNDSISLYSLAECLRIIDIDKNRPRCDQLYKNVIDLAPGTPQAEKSKDRRRELAYKGFREVSELRPDAVMYCLDALNKFNDMTSESIGGVAMEAATLGQSGLEVNNPDKRYQLRTIPGDYSGLNIVCILHTAIQKVAPGNDSGFDVQAEYNEALKLFKNQA